MGKTKFRHTVRELRPRRAKPEVDAWRIKSKNNYPYWPTIFVSGAGITILACFGILYRADGRPVEDWFQIAPSVLLSILAVAARTLAEEGFKSGAEAFWWGKLVSEKGVSLSELHHTWEFTHERIPLAFRRRPWNLVRAAALSVLLLTAVGPLLQRSLIIEQLVETTAKPVTLPIRVEPQWNLTTLDPGDNNGAQWAASMYQPEFANVIIGYRKRQPLRLAGDRSFCEGNCTADITVAGFDRNCTEELKSPTNLTHLFPAQVIWLRGERLNCSLLGSPNSTVATDPDDLMENNPYCANLETYYEVFVVALSDMLGFGSYVRPDPRNASLLVQRCLFTTAFLTMTIDITDGTAVTISNRQPPRTVALIGDPTEMGFASPFLDGFLQVMADIYQGYVLWEPSRDHLPSWETRRDTTPTHPTQQPGRIGPATRGS